MLILTRNIGESLTIHVPELPSETLKVRDVFKAGPIEFMVTYINRGKVKLGVRANKRFVVLRGELSAEKRMQIISRVTTTYKQR